MTHHLFPVHTALFPTSSLLCYFISIVLLICHGFDFSRFTLVWVRESALCRRASLGPDQMLSQGAWRITGFSFFAARDWMIPGDSVVNVISDKPCCTYPLLFPELGRWEGEGKIPVSGERGREEVAACRKTAVFILLFAVASAIFLVFPGGSLFFLCLLRFFVNKLNFQPFIRKGFISIWT